MPSCQSIPRIRINLPDSSPCSFSPSSTLDITDILGQAKLFPKLLAEDFVFDDDALCFEDGHLQDFPSFPMGRRPPLFILQSYRARLPFAIRQDAFELGDFCRDEEDACPLLTAPTIPRMKLMIKEGLYVQKWADALTPDHPPNHIPWICEKPVATRKRWISEGSIFPAHMVKSSIEQHGAVHERSCITNTNSSSATPADKAPHSRELRASSEASAPTHATTESHTSTLPTRIKPADVDPVMFRGESRTLHPPHRIIRTSTISSPPTLLSVGSSIGRTSNTPDAPLAARRGKSLSGLKLQGSVIEHLEYPDIPTAFRGSLVVSSPRFDIFPVPPFTDHESMLFDLKSKCAALGSGALVYIQEPPRPQIEPTHTIDERAFTRGLGTFDSSLGSTDSQVPREIIADASVFLPNGSSTPVKDPSFTAYLEFVPRPHPTCTLQPPINRLSDPPGVPLPPRPALTNPSTPPHVRGILKKVKSVRFEDTITKQIENHAVVLPSQVFSERSSPLLLAASSERSCTPTANTAKPPSDTASVKEAPGNNIQEKKSVPRSRLPPTRARTNGKLQPTRFNVGSTPETSRPTLVTTPVERLCRNAHVKENTDPATPRAQAKQKGLSSTEIDIRKGIEGATKSRLSTPLRNIFRFR